MASRRTRSALWIGGTALAATVLVVACPPLVVTPFEGFSYASRVAPRVFAEHRPLRPAPGTELTIRLVPEVVAGTTVPHAFASLRQGTAAAVEKECDAQTDGSFLCRFDLASDTASATYSGRIVLSNGARVATRASYAFSVGNAFAGTELIAVRVPITRVDRLLAEYRIDTAFIRGVGNNYEVEQFVGDAEQALYGGILADPVYRWRDDQLGFYVYTRPGLVTSYYSGFDTRCGQNPWPAEATLAAALAPMEVIGVLHRLTADASAAEGRVPPGSTATAFRDCAGNAARPFTAGATPTLRTFSAVGGIAESPGIATHEFGHAAFELGDEYFETDATRRVNAAVQLQPPAECCCNNSGGVVITPKPGPGTGGSSPGTGTVSPGGGATTPGTAAGGFGLDVAVCMGPGATIGSGIGDGSLPACTGEPSDFAAACGASPQGGCPPLESACVHPRMWLGATPPDASVTARHNVFPSETECSAAKAAAEIHPGVEIPARALGNCRKLCGGGGGAPACPCGQSEAWIVDTDPSAPLPTARDDLMAAPAMQRLGGTCAWCVDTSLCVRWHRALGDSVDATWSACSAPPRSATGFEAVLDVLARWIAECIEALLRHVRFVGS